MSNTVDEIIDEQTFFSMLKEAGLHEILIESFREDRDWFKRQNVKFNYGRKINGASDIYYIKTDHPLYGSKTIKLEKKYAHDETKNGQ